MRFTLTDHFDAPLDAVESASLDPAFQDRLTGLPNVAERTVVRDEPGPDGTRERVIRYRFGGDLPGPVKAVVGSAVSWDEVGRYDPGSHTWTFHIEPHVAKDKLECRGSYRFAADGEGSVREVEVDLRVRVPLVGGRVERAIRDGLVDTLEAEARLLRDYVKERA